MVTMVTPLNRPSNEMRLRAAGVLAEFTNWLLLCRIGLAPSRKLPQSLRPRLPPFLRGSMMNRMSFSETIFLFFLALVVFGPKKLPEIARQVGKFMNEFRRASNEFKAQIEQEIAHLEVDKQTILPPSTPVEGTTSRSWNAVEAEAVPTNPPATLVASIDPPAPGAQEGTPEAPPIATEAVHPPDAVTSPSSQESHA